MSFKIKINDSLYEILIDYTRNVTIISKIRPNNPQFSDYITTINSILDFTHNPPNQNLKLSSPSCKIMKCIFCNNQVELGDWKPPHELCTPYHGDPYGWCHNHHVPIYFKWHEDYIPIIDKPNKRSVSITLQKKMITEPQNDLHLPYKAIYQDLIKKTTTLYQNGPYGTLLTLNYLPELNPFTFYPLLNRLLNLVVFS